MFSKDLRVTWDLSAEWAVLHNGPLVTACTRTFWQHIGWMGCTPAAGCSLRRLRSFRRLADHCPFLAGFSSNATKVKPSEAVAGQLQTLLTIAVREALDASRHHAIRINVRLFIATTRHPKYKCACNRLKKRRLNGSEHLSWDADAWDLQWTTPT